jgi:uncharacterized coiled-coil protein SlyX
MRRPSAAATAVAVILAALLLVAKASAGSPTRASWALAANRDCAAANTRIRALPLPQTSKLLIRDTRSTLAISKQVTRQLSLIPRPRRERAAILKLLTNSRTQNRIVHEQLLPALVGKNQQRIQRTAAELKPLGTRFNKLARSLGARVCAENPAPHGP